ncbi:MAG: MarR family transcriptional regulator [Actinomadura rubrobrunea]|nr:MarR family transcriptional regulator [Actinomadura rubrobrunea]
MSPPQQAGPGTAASADAAPAGTRPDAPPGVPADVPADIVEIERALTWVAHLLTRHRQHDRTVAAAGVPVDRAAVPLLRLLDDSAEPLRPSELAARLNVEAPHVTRLVQRLEKVGYVDRVPDARDRRAQRVRLRAEGRHAVECIRTARRRWMHEALASWSEEERRQLAELVNRMVDDLLAHSAEQDCAGPGA